MYYSAIVYFYLSLFAHLATGQTTYETKSLCTTAYGTKSVAPRSYGYKLTVPLTYQKRTTITPVSTITPLPITTTTTSTSTSTVTTTSTSTSTITQFTDSTSTVTSMTSTTSTIVEVSTTTTTPSSVVVPTSSGFTPLASSSDYVAKKRSVEDGIPAIRGRAPSLIKFPPVHGNGQFQPQVYPTSTICATLIEAITTNTKTFTGSSTSTTTLPASTSTQTSVVSTTTTVTVAADPAVTTTIITNTVMTTITKTTTDSTTSTSTQTIVAPASTTLYDQCQSNNVVGAANGNHGISYVNLDSKVMSLNSNSISDPVQCCVSCAQAMNCAGYAQLPGGKCYYFTWIAGQCDGSNSSPNYYYVPLDGITAGQGYIIGNGQCGQLHSPPSSSWGG